MAKARFESASAVCILLWCIDATASTHNLSVSPCLGTTSRIFGDSQTSGTWELIGGRDVVWQIPKHPRAVLFMAHGRNLSSLSYFDHGSECQKCYGLPEDRHLTLEALSRGYAVIAIKSHGCEWKSWPVDESKDIKDVSAILHKWTWTHHLQELPVVAIGSSAGGNFTTTLSLRFPFKSIALIVSGGVYEALGTFSLRMYPTIFFAHMVHDLDMEAQVQASLALLRTKGVRTDDVKCFPQTISPSYFSERIVGLTAEISAQIRQVFKSQGYLDERDFFVVWPPAVDWVGDLRRSAVLLPEFGGGSKLMWQDSIQQEIMVANGMHSITSLPSRAIFDWFKASIFRTHENLQLEHSKSR